MPGGFAEALSVAFSLEGALLLLAGTVAGAVSGLIPGLSGLTGMALFLPLTLAMPPGGALMFFAGLSGAPRFTGAILSIVLNIPGSPVNAATAFDGYPMARRGQADRAISIAAMSSIMGTLFGLIVLLLLMPVILTVLRVVGPQELFALAVLALTTIAFSSTTDAGGFIKGLASGGIGLMLGFMGVATVTGSPRFNFGSESYLYDGIRLVPLFIGVFAVAQVLRFAVDERGTVAGAESGGPGRGGVRRGMADTFRHWRILLQGSAIGSAIGVLPGVGGVAANFLSYSWTKGRSKQPERYGTGIPEGVVATEGSNNAEMVSSIVPTISFGIPGSAEGALILGLLTLQGYLTGPLLLQLHPETLWILVLGALVSAIVVSVLGLMAVGALARVTIVPITYLVPTVLVASLFGTYAAEINIWDVATAVVCGIVGYFFLRYNFSAAALVIGYVLANLTEDSFVLGWQAGGQAYGSFFTRPVAVVVWLITGLILVMSFVSARRNRRQAQGGEGAGVGGTWSYGLPGIVFTVLVAVFVGTLVGEATGLAPRARLVPLVIGVPTLGLLLLSVVVQFLRWRAVGYGTTKAMEGAGPPGGGGRVGVATRTGTTREARLLLSIAWLVAYTALLYTIGFLWGSVLATAAYTAFDLSDDPEKSFTRAQVATRAVLLAAGVWLLLWAAQAIGMSTFEGVLFGDSPPPF